MKTPTIKELRALAARKGLELVVNGGRLDCYSGTTLRGIACCAHYSTSECWSELTKAQAYSVLSAALRALPDKKVAR